MPETSSSVAPGYSGPGSSSGRQVGCLALETAGEEHQMRWSVGIEAEGDRVLTREEVVELADAVAASGGIASGIGTSRYGARLIVEAADREAAIEKGTGEFTRA